MENLIMEIEKSMHQRRSLSVLNNEGFGYNSFHNYSLNPSINSSINQLFLNNPSTDMSSNFLRGSPPIISPPRLYSSSFPLNHHHHHHHHNRPPLLPLPIKSTTLPSTNKKQKKKKQQQQQQQQSKPNYSNITIPKTETKTEDAMPKAKKDEKEDTEEEILIIGSLSKTAVTSLYTWISPPPPSRVPMPRLLLKPKINNAGSCNAETLDSAGATDDLHRLLCL